MPFLLFDLGGVLVENTGFPRLDALLPRPIGDDALKRRWLASDCVRRFELGRIDAGTFARTLVDEWALACSVDEFLEELAGWPKGFYPGAREMLATLRGTYRIGCLSNSNSVHWDRFDGFDGLFDVTLASHLAGRIKPDPACFAHAIEACGVPAADIVFFDDAEANVEGARKAGLDATHVDGFADVRRNLRERRLMD